MTVGLISVLMSRAIVRLSIFLLNEVTKSSLSGRMIGTSLMMFSDGIVDAKEQAGEIIDDYLLVKHWSGYGVCDLYKSALSGTNQEGGRTLHTRIMVDSPF